MLLSLLFAAIVPNAVPQAALDASDIFVRARQALNAMPLPPYVVFTYQDRSEWVVQYPVGVTHFVDQDRARLAVRTSDGHAFLQVLKTRSGMRVRWEPIVIGDNRDDLHDILLFRAGDFPAADFGLRFDVDRPGLFEARPDPKRGVASGLKIIGTVRTNNLPYRIERLADGVVGGSPVYHLKLTPLRDPSHNVLREMWVDQATFLPRRYVADRFVGAPPAYDYLVTVDTRLISGSLINVSGRGAIDTYNMLLLPGAPAALGRTEYVADAWWQISNIALPPSLPDWLFDPDTFRYHRKEPVPSVVTDSPAATQPRPLPAIRHLVFDYSRTSPAGVSPANSAVAPIPVATPVPAAGRISVDVVATTADDGLIADVAETPADSPPRTRIRIGADGALFGDAAAELSREEAVVLSLLGRSAIGSAIRQPGESWSVPHGSSSSVEKTTFRIADVSAASIESLDVAESASAAFNDSADAPLDGTVLYNPAKSVPIQATLTTETHPDAIAPHATTFRITLAVDSFSKQ